MAEFGDFDQIFASFADKKIAKKANKAPCIDLRFPFTDEA